MLQAVLLSFVLSHATIWTRADGDHPNSGLYEHNIIQTAINACLFKNRLDIGVEFAKYFRPFPCVALMTIITAVSYVGNFFGHIY